MTDPDGNSFSIRTAAKRDATQVSALADQFADYLRGLGDKADFQFNAEAYLRDGFGSNPAFKGIVAERGDTICREQGGQELLWSVYEPNKLAARFYEQLGARYVGGLVYMVLSV